MKIHKRVLWITHTAIYLALLLVSQAVIRAFGQYVLGSVVNLILITSVAMAGIWSGATVALLSPLLAFFFGFGPAFPQIIPVVMLGNLVLILIWGITLNKTEGKKYLFFWIATFAAAVAKFSVLWFGIVKIAVPWLGLPEAQASVISAAFSYPQLITASIGGVVASMVLPVLLRVIKKPD